MSAYVVQFSEEDLEAVQDGKVVSFNLGDGYVFIAGPDTPQELIRAAGQLGIREAKEAEDTDL